MFMHVTSLLYSFEHTEEQLYLNISKVVRGKRSICNSIVHSANNQKPVRPFVETSFCWFVVWFA